MPHSNNPTASGAWVRRATAKETMGSRMPTKTTSPSRISRAAAMIISSWVEYRTRLFGREVGGGGQPAALYPQSIEPGSELGEIGCVVGWSKHPFLEPVEESIALARAAMIFVEEFRVALPHPGHGRRVNAGRAFDDRRDDEARIEHPVGVRGDDLGRHDLFGQQDDALRSHRRLLRDARRAPEMAVSEAIGPLD